MPTLAALPASCKCCSSYGSACRLPALSEYPRALRVCSLAGKLAGAACYKKPGSWQAGPAGPCVCHVAAAGELAVCLPALPLPQRHAYHPWCVCCRAAHQASPQTQPLQALSCPTPAARPRHRTCPAAAAARTVARPRAPPCPPAPRPCAAPCRVTPAPAARAPRLASPPQNRP